MKDMACSELVDTITAYLDGTLADVDRERLDAHLAQCPFCTEYVAQMRATIARLETLDTTTLAPRTRDDLLTAFRDWAAEPPL
jgi:anti-sigma factor RsiW